jgi:hypothetical protein
MENQINNYLISKGFKLAQKQGGNFSYCKYFADKKSTAFISFQKFVNYISSLNVSIYFDDVSSLIYDFRLSQKNLILPRLKEKKYCFGQFSYYNFDLFYNRKKDNALYKRKFISIGEEIEINELLHCIEDQLFSFLFEYNEIKNLIKFFEKVDNLFLYGDYQLAFVISNHLKNERRKEFGDLWLEHLNDKKKKLEIQKDFSKSIDMEAEIIYATRFMEYFQMLEEKKNEK